MPVLDQTRETVQPAQPSKPPAVPSVLSCAASSFSCVLEMAGVLSSLLVLGACARREVPAEWPAKSAASPAADAAPVALVTRSLDGPPPLPGDEAAGWVGLRGPSSPAAHEHVAPAGDTVRYVCPMHPEVVADRIGNCPRCGMGLVKRDAPR